MNHKKYHSYSSSPRQKNLYHSFSIKNLNSNINQKSNYINNLHNKIYKSNVFKVQQIKKKNNEINSLNDKIRL